MRKAAEAQWGGSSGKWRESTVWALLHEPDGPGQAPSPWTLVLSSGTENVGPQLANSKSATKSTCISTFQGACYIQIPRSHLAPLAQNL